MNVYGLDVDALVRLLEKRDGRPVAIVDLRGRRSSAVCRMTARLASRSEVTDLART